MIIREIKEKVSLSKRTGYEAIGKSFCLECILSQTGAPESLHFFLQCIQVGIIHRRDVEGDELGEEESTDDSDAEG